MCRWTATLTFLRALNSSPSTTYVLSKGQDCCVVLQGVHMAVPHTWKNKLKHLDCPTAIKIKDTSLKKLKILYMKEKPAKCSAMKGIHSLLSASIIVGNPLCAPHPSTADGWNTCRFQQASGPLNILLTQMTEWGTKEPKESLRGNTGSRIL